MITHKDQEMGLTTMKSARDVANSKRGKCPSRKTLKGGMPQYDDSQRSRNRSSNERSLQNVNELKDEGMPQYDNSQRSRDRMSSEKVCKKRIDELKDEGMPQCKIVVNMGHRMSLNKILWDMLMMMQ